MLQTVAYASTRVSTFTDVASHATTLASLASPGGQLSAFAYDGEGNRTSRIWLPNERSTYTYDENSRLKSEIDFHGQRTTSTYDAASRRILLQKADTSRTSLTFNAADQLLSQYDLRPDDSVVDGMDYLVDPTGNRTRMRHATGVLTTWTYDDSYQLIREQRTAVTGTFDTTFTYDPTGNLGCWTGAYHCLRMVNIDWGKVCGKLVYGPLKGGSH